MESLTLWVEPLTGWALVFELGRAVVLAAVGMMIVVWGCRRLRR